MELRPALPLGVVDSPLFVPDATYGAIKGLGGYHLAVDAGNQAAVLADFSRLGC